MRHSTDDNGTKSCTLCGGPMPCLCFDDEVRDNWGSQKYARLKLSNPELDDKGIHGIWDDYDSHGDPR